VIRSIAAPDGALYYALPSAGGPFVIS